MLDSFQLGYIATQNGVGDFYHLECDEQYRDAEFNYEEYLDADRAAYLADSGNRMRFGPGLAGWYPQRLVDFIGEKFPDLAEAMVIRYTIHEEEQRELDRQVEHIMSGDLGEYLDDNIALARALAAFVLPIVDAEAEDEPLTAKDITNFIEEWLSENLDAEVLCSNCNRRIS